MPVNPTDGLKLFFDDVLLQNPRLDPDSLAGALQAVAERDSSINKVTLTQMMRAWNEIRNAVEALNVVLPKAVEDRRQGLETELALLRARHLILLTLYERKGGTHPLVDQAIGEAGKALQAAHRDLEALEKAKGIPRTESLAVRIFRADRLPFEFITGEPPVRARPAPVVTPPQSEAAVVPSGGELDDDFFSGEVSPSAAVDSPFWFQRLLRGLRRLLFRRAADREENLSAESLIVGMFIFANGDLLRPVEPYHHDTAPVVELSQGIEEEPDLTESVESGEVVEEVEEGAEMGEEGTVFDGSGASSGLFFHGLATPLNPAGIAAGSTLRVIRGIR